MKSLIAITFTGLLSLLPLTSLAQTSKPSDAQIAAIVVAANTVDISAGKLAQEQASDQAVKNFARQMVTNHAGVNKQAFDLVKKLKMTPEENDTSKSLEKDGEANITKLKGLKGKEFDKAYIDNEVKYHQTVIDAMDQTLIPNARNPSLKELLMTVRPAFVAHLDHAKKLQANMK